VGLKGHEARETRGRILKILERAYPDEIGDELISLTLNDIHMCTGPAILRGHIDYLEEKGYVESRELHSDELEMSRRMVRLTAKGKDLLEGSISPDPGVNL
jgi:DNA-binding MarR family transcriptional regulator